MRDRCDGHATIGYQFLHASGSFFDPRSIIDDSRNFPLGFNIDVSAPVAPHVRLVGEVNWGRHRDTFTANLNVDRTATAVGGGIRLLSPSDPLAQRRSFR